MIIFFCCRIWWIINKLYNNNEIKEKTKTLKDYFNYPDKLIEITYSEQNDENNITRISQSLNRNTNVLSANTDSVNRNSNTVNILDSNIRQNILEDTR